MRRVVAALILTGSVASAEPTADVSVGPVVVWPAFHTDNAVAVMPSVAAGGFVTSRLAVLGRLGAFAWDQRDSGSPPDVGSPTYHMAEVTLAAEVQWWATPRMWFGGGAGVADIRTTGVNPDVVPPNDFYPAFDARLGVVLARGLAITASVDVVPEHKMQWSRTTSLGLALAYQFR